MRFAASSFFGALCRSLQLMLPGFFKETFCEVFSNKNKGKEEPDCVDPVTMETFWEKRCSHLLFKTESGGGGEGSLCRCFTDWNASLIFISRLLFFGCFLFLRSLWPRNAQARAMATERRSRCCSSTTRAASTCASRPTAASRAASTRSARASPSRSAPSDPTKR